MNELFGTLKVSIWGLTTQNEPSAGLIPWFPFQSLGFTATTQRDFIAQDLAPALSAAGLRRVKVIILDDQRFLVPKYADTVMGDPAAAKAVDGIGLHWYFNRVTPTSYLSETHDRHPDKFMLSTEACEGFVPWLQKSVILGEWSRAETYATDIIEVRIGNEIMQGALFRVEVFFFGNLLSDSLQSLQNWVGGWTDWNLALNTEGGPNWARNFVDSPIIVNQCLDVFYKQPMYYALAHFR